MTEQREQLPVVTLTTDGAARGNPGPGAWAALLQRSGGEKLLVGEHVGDTTNNAMELMAVVGGLEALKRRCRVTLRADSLYVIHGLQSLLEGGALPKKNRELWQRLHAAAQKHVLEFEWVKGHSGDARNERVNTEANAAAARAYSTREAAQAQARPADGWVLALCSPAGKRPAQWAVLTPGGRRAGSLAVAGGASEPTTVYQALVQALEAARELAAGQWVDLTVMSNYELIVKQGRGEWQVKQPAQRELAAQALRLRAALGEVRFEFAPTASVLELIGN